MFLKHLLRPFNIHVNNLVLCLFSFSCIDSHIHFIPHRRIGLSKSLLGEEAYNRTLEKLNKDLPEDKKVRTVK